MSYIITYTGKRVYPLEPTADMFEIVDIAEHLSKICRYTGACRGLYSVGQHSILVAQQLPPRLQLAGLLHDATEAYMHDLPGPLKSAMPEYIAAEKAMARIIASHFGLDGLTDIDWEKVKDADHRMLATEWDQLMPAGTIPEEYDCYKRFDIHIEPWTQLKAAVMFIKMFRDLTTKAQAA